MIRPDPAETWDLVLNLLQDGDVPACQLFASHDAEGPPTWAQTKRR